MLLHHFHSQYLHQLEEHVVSSQLEIHSLLLLLRGFFSNLLHKAQDNNNKQQTMKANNECRQQTKTKIQTFLHIFAFIPLTEQKNHIQKSKTNQKETNFFLRINKDVKDQLFQKDFLKRPP